MFISSMTQHRLVELYLYYQLVRKHHYRSNSLLVHWSLHELHYHSLRSFFSDPYKTPLTSFQMSLPTRFTTCVRQVAPSIFIAITMSTRIRVLRWRRRRRWIWPFLIHTNNIFSGFYSSFKNHIFSFLSNVFYQLLLFYYNLHLSHTVTLRYFSSSNSKRFFALFFLP
jgi:hypothetical protein